LQQQLVIQDNRQQLKENEDFYLVEKAMWDLFLNLYGGGPAIVKIEKPGS